MDFEQELAETVAALPQDPPEGTVGIMEARGLLRGNVLIYRADHVAIPGETKKRKMVKVYCTVCQSYGHLEYMNVEGCARAAWKG